MSILQKRIVSSGNGCPPQVDCGAWASSWPALAEFVSMAVWPDGTARQPGTLMVLTDLGQWKLWLHDRDSNQSSFVSGSTPEVVFARAEKGLVESSLEWRSDRSSGQKGRR
jgi:hypothetical protein